MTNLEDFQFSEQAFWWQATTVGDWTADSVLKGQFGKPVARSSIRPNLGQTPDASLKFPLRNLARDKCSVC